MKFPIPNVLYFSLNEAKKKLHEYNVKCVHKCSNKALPGFVFAYKANKSKNEVVIYVAEKPKNSFSLDENIEYVNVVNKVTGRRSINKKVLLKANVGATDLGIPLKIDNRTIFLYGDTFSGKDVNDGSWNSNFIAISEREDYENSLLFSSVVTDSNGIIKPICQGLHDRDEERNLDLSLKKEVTKIPTGAILIGDDVCVFLMHVRHWGKAGEWFVTDNVCYKANKYKLDDFKPTSLSFSCLESERLGQLFPFENEFDTENIYFLSIPGGRNGHLSLLRVKRERFFDKEAYELCVGENKFLPLKKGLKEKPFYLIEDKASEPSIMYNHYLNKWIVSLIGPDALYFYTSDSLFGGYEKIKILTHKEFPSFYGGFVSSFLSKYNGKKMFIQVSQWSPIYNTSLLEIVFK